MVFSRAKDAKAKENTKTGESKQWIMIDKEINKKLQLKEKINQSEYEFYEIASSESVEKWIEAINKTAEKGKQTIHLIAHGKPGHLQLGSGASVEVLDQLSATSKNTIVIWGCNFGQSQHCNNRNSNRLVTANTTLGNQNTIEGLELSPKQFMNGKKSFLPLNGSPRETTSKQKQNPSKIHQTKINGSLALSKGRFFGKAFKAMESISQRRAKSPQSSHQIAATSENGRPSLAIKRVTLRSHYQAA